MNIPRSEYPRPQMIRENWMNLNGEWEFEIDHSRSGRERNLQKSKSLNQKITVPFCPESILSGIHNKDFMECVWYKRKVVLPKQWSDRTLLHIGACDYKTTVWVNGFFAGEHCGGYSSFNFDISDYLIENENDITILAEDYLRQRSQPAGKQSTRFESYGCLYTRTTGIWQTVWLEGVSTTYIKQMKIYPDPDNQKVHIEGRLDGPVSNLTLTSETFFQNEATGSEKINLNTGSFTFSVSLDDIRLWDVENPNLYDISFVLSDSDQVLDTVKSYFGLRTISLTNNEILLNNKPVFQRLVLDQGFYPDGIYTAPTDDALKNDIILSKNCGFNGARLHEKVFEERFLYWADKLGYLVWGEQANWALDISDTKAVEVFMPEWIEVMNRDFNHPALVGWCPFNETWDKRPEGTKQDNRVLKAIYDITRQIDPTRPCIDTSGNFHVITDIFDIHDYTQDTAEFSSHYELMKTDKSKSYNNFPDRQKYEGQPYFISEYGGIKWDIQNQEGWGYGNPPKTEEEFIARYESLTHTLLDNPHICAFCYTQLYDVEQELNGLYTYDRKPKFDISVFKKINSRKAAIEKQLCP
ncbi:MAG: beta-galactosidase [Clostridia bacterium]|nr:beta-galactosidase [Clostridia bacterium]